MVRARDKKLVDFIDQQVGEYLRAAISFNGDDLDVLWVRPDLRTETTREIIPNIQERFHERKQLLGNQAQSPLGKLFATTEIYQDGILLFFADDAGGVIITLDREAGRDLVGFVDRCAEILDRPEI